MWRVFSASKGTSLWGTFEDLIAVVIVVGGFRFRGVVRAPWRALVVGSLFRPPVWSSGRRTGPGLIFRSWPTPLALIVRLLRVGLPLHPPLLNWTVAAGVVILRACRATRAARLTARAVPSSSIWLAIGCNALPVAALLLRSWPAVSLLSELKKKVHS